MKNTISIKEGLLHIEEKQKITSHWLRFLFAVLGIEAMVYWLKFYKGQENDDLVKAMFISLLVVVFVAREVWFRTGRNIIELKEIRSISVQKILFEKEKVYLNIKLRRKTRVVLVHKDEAEEIRKKIETVTRRNPGNHGKRAQNRL